MPRNFTYDRVLKFPTVSGNMIFYYQFIAKPRYLDKISDPPMAC